MHRTSLFDLPKELLIEIILNVKKQNEKEKEELMRRSDGSKIYNCEYENCKKFKVKNRYGDVIYSKDEDDDIDCCDICRAEYCESHDKILHTDCCGIQQCRHHHKCQTCETPLCLWCQKNMTKCEKCI